MNKPQACTKQESRPACARVAQVRIRKRRRVRLGRPRRRCTRKRKAGKTSGPNPGPRCRRPSVRAREGAWPGVCRLPPRRKVARLPVQRRSRATKRRRAKSGPGEPVALVRRLRHHRGQRQTRGSVGGGGVSGWGCRTLVPSCENSSLSLKQFCFLWRKGKRIRHLRSPTLYR